MLLIQQFLKSFYTLLRIQIFASVRRCAERAYSPLPVTVRMHLHFGGEFIVDVQRKPLVHMGRNFRRRFVYNPPRQMPRIELARFHQVREFLFSRSVGRLTINAIRNFK